jgi:hypothetical protein
MRMTKIHKVVVTAVVTTIAAATVLTFTRGDSASTDRIASLRQPADDVPVVAERTPGTIKKATTPGPSATTASPTPTPADATTKVPRPSKTTSGNPPTRPTTRPVKPTKRPAAPTTRPAEPTTAPAPAPSPTPREKNLLEILLGL